MIRMGLAAHHVDGPFGLALGAPLDDPQQQHKREIGTLLTICCSHRSHGGKAVGIARGEGEEVNRCKEILGRWKGLLSVCVCVCVCVL